jgi:hypothetical protein
MLIHQNEWADARKKGTTYGRDVVMNELVRIQAAA